MRGLWILAWAFGTSALATDFDIVTENHPPVQFEAQGEVKGSATQIVRLLLSRAQLSGRIRVMPWARAFKTALGDENVLIYSMLRSAAREAHFHWIGPVARVNPSLLKLSKRQDIQVSRLSDAKPYLIGIMRDSYAHDYLLKLGFSEKDSMHLMGTVSEQVRLFANGKVDLLLTDPLVVRQKLNALGYAHLGLDTVLPIPEKARDLYLAASINTEKGKLKQLRQAWEVLIKQPEYSHLYRQGGGE